MDREKNKGSGKAKKKGTRCQVYRYYPSPKYGDNVQQGGKKSREKEDQKEGINSSRPKKALAEG